MSERKFYVYEHWRPDKDVCFYVGKGAGRRANSTNSRNPHHKNIQAKLARLGMCFEVRLVADCLTEDEAFDVEIQCIAFWNDMGVTLTNQTRGGEGLSNPSEEVREKLRKASTGNTYMVGRHHSESTKAKISAAHKGKEPNWDLIRRLAEINRGNTHMVGKKASAETRAKMSAAHMGNQYGKGYRHSAESRARMSESRRGRKQPPSAIEKTVSVHRKPVRCLTDGKEFRSAVEAGVYYGLFNHAKVAEVCRGVRKTAAGRTFEYIKKEHA